MLISIIDQPLAGGISTHWLVIQWFINSRSEFPLSNWLSYATSGTHLFIHFVPRKGPFAFRSDDPKIHSETEYGTLQGAPTIIYQNLELTIFHRLGQGFESHLGNIIQFFPKIEYLSELVQNLCSHPVNKFSTSILLQPFIWLVSSSTCGKCVDLQTFVDMFFAHQKTRLNYVSVRREHKKAHVNIFEGKISCTIL